MRRFAAVLSVVGIASALMLVGVPAATAVDPAPGPVPEMADMPSKYGNYYNPSTIGPPGSPSYQEWSKAMDEWIAREYARRGTTNPYLKPPATPSAPTPVSALQAAPKPLTIPTALIRTGGTALAAGTLGWAVASNGTIAAISAINNDSIASVYCAQPDWYQGVTLSLSLGMGPDCTVYATAPNIDTETTIQFASGRAVKVLPFSGSGYVGTKICASGPTLYGGPTTLEVGFSGGTGGASGVATSPVRFNNCPTMGTAWAGEVTNCYTSHTSSPTCPGLVVTSARIFTTATGATTETAVIDSPNPLRTPSCEITWQDGTTTQGTGQQYREEGGIPISAEGLGCSPAYEAKTGRGPSMMPTRIKVDSDLDGVDTTISDQTVPAYTDEEKLPYGNGNGHGLELKKAGTSCMTWEASCVDWWDDTSSGTVPGDYTCTYGGAAVALTQCSVYQKTFDTVTASPVITDPATGDDVEWVTAPGTGPGSHQGNANSTDPGTSIDPGDACFESWPPFSIADPITWVMHPVYCAIVKAFAPRQSVVDMRFAEAEAVWATKPPAVLIEAAGQIDSMTGPTGCSIPITILGVTADVVNVCDGLMAQLPIFTRLITGAYAVIIVYTKLRQQTAAMVNYNVGQT